MKLVLANNQSAKFVSFYNNLKQQSNTPFDYGGYKELLFVFDALAEYPIVVRHLGSGRLLQSYDGVYINGYLPVYELAAAVAICCDYLKIAYVNQELQNPPSLSKLSMHAKLAAAGVPTPRTFAGTKYSLLAGREFCDLNFPAILKRADADRGIDNFKVKNWEDMTQTLADHDDKSLWILQQFVPNQGYYLVSYYSEKPAFSIFRSLEERADKDEKKAHFYKPKGGANASLIPLEKLPLAVSDACFRGIKAMNRQIASVDCLYDPNLDRAYVLEVNYNPQLVTITTFQEVRQQAFIENLKDIKY